MKILSLFLIFIALFTGDVSSQPKQTDVFLIKDPGQRDTLLSGWKIANGDHLAWAVNSFDDKNWKSFDPTSDVNNIKGSGIHWLRMKIQIDSSLLNTPMALQISQSVASEIYLDGKLIGQLGTISPSVSGQRYNTQPIRFSITDQNQHLLALRFAKPSGLLSMRLPGLVLPVAELRLSRYQTAIDAAQSDHSRNAPRMALYAFFAGVCAILTIIHLSIYSLTRHKAHLFYALVNLIGTFESISNYHSILGIDSPVALIWILLISWTLQNGLCMLTLTVYALFGYRNKTAYRLLIGLSVLAMLMVWIKTDIGFYLTIFVVPVVNFFETVRIGIWAGKRKLPGAWFVVIGVCLFFSFLFFAQFVPEAKTHILMALAQLSFPVGMAIFLAIQTALTNRTLEGKLMEVASLSDRNLEQEKEKQQILSSQNTVLEQQVKARTLELSNSLDRLKETQTQLIQSEKMASLGELTAGIAHEIQNPLNFVNNFSDVSIELLEEMNEELDKGDTAEAKTISTDIKQNLEKIAHHGRRAESIVKGMLQHSRASGGQKELVDVNTLIDEYLRLSYHGLRAKNKDFNAELLTDYAEDLPLLNLMPQDVGRALLNLFNNAFYAVQQQVDSRATNYKPVVRVKTELKDNNVYILVNDNGSGIPAAIKEKIMQPFFTTKPTGQGTGLGLSLTYDIIVKGHNGQILVESIEGEGTTFTLIFPVELTE